VLELSASNVQTIIAEIGTDMSCFAMVKHFCAWCQGMRFRAARCCTRNTAQVANRATQAFRMAAYAVSRSDTAIGAYYRSMRAREG
jgi:transposase